MSIQGYVNELKNLKIELKRLNKISAQIRKQIKNAEDNIILYLTEKQQPGVKYHNDKIILQNTTKRNYKKKKDKEEDAINILKQKGISNPEEVLNQILEARRGEEVEVSKIKIERLT